MRKLFIPVAAASLAASAFITQAAVAAPPARAAAPASVASYASTAVSASDSYSCQVSYFSWTHCATTTVPAGDTLWIGINSNISDVTVGDFEIDDPSGNTLGSDYGLIGSTGGAQEAVWTNNTGADVTAIIWGSADNLTDSGTMAGTFSVSP